MARTAIKFISSIVLIHNVESIHASPGGLVWAHLDVLLNSAHLRLIYKAF